MQKLAETPQFKFASESVEFKATPDSSRKKHRLHPSETSQAKRMKLGDADKTEQPVTTGTVKLRRASGGRLDIILFDLTSCFTNPLCLLVLIC